MATNKERKNQLVKWANEVIQDTPKVCKNGIIENESFNGQIAAFSVSVALSGLKPAMAIYYSNTGNSSIDKPLIIEMLSKMYSKENAAKNKEEFFKMVIGAVGEKEQTLRTKIIEYAIALKLAIRTFKFKKS